MLSQISLRALSSIWVVIALSVGLLVSADAVSEELQLIARVQCDQLA